MCQSHDKRYKKLFSNPMLVQELLESFVDLPFVNDLDYSTLEYTNKSFVTREYKSKESDLIYKVKYKGKTAYIYLLLEFQSTIDNFMPLRILRYILELYDDILKHSKSKPKKLPAVFPIMLYNGDKKWDAPENIKDIIESYGINEIYIPNFSYYKIDENDFSKKQLFEISNGVAAIFYAEKSDPTKLAEYVQEVVMLIKKELPEVVTSINDWVINFTGNREEINYIIEKTQGITEGRSMLATAIKGYGEIKIKEGLEQGIEQGIYKKAIIDAKKLKAEGVDIAIIARCTGLTVEVVEGF